MDFTQTQRVLDSYPVIIGIDWADRQHAIWEFDTQEKEGQHTKLQNTPSVIHQWLMQVKKRYQADQILVCMENSDTNLKHTLSVCGWVDLIEVTESKLANFRDTFSTSGAKDDPTDAKHLVQLYLHHPGQFEINTPDQQNTRMLDQYARKRRKLVDNRADQVNTVKSELKKYFPQAIELTGSSMYTDLAIDFLKRWSTLRELKHENPDVIKQFYHDHSVRGTAVQERIKLIKNARPVTDDEAIIEPSKNLVEGLIGSIEEFTRTIKDMDQKLESTFQDHQDQSIWSSFPGAGTQMAPRLLVAFGDDRTNWNQATQMQEYSGMAPVTEQSGKGCWVHWRWGAPNFLKQTFFEYANLSRQQSDWAKAFYEMKRDQGDDHQTAVRKLAFKWIRIMYRCWKEQTEYSETTYIKALIRSDSPVVEYIEADIEPLKKKVA